MSNKKTTTPWPAIINPSSKKTQVLLLAGLALLALLPGGLMRKSAIGGTSVVRQCAQHEGIIIANMHGRTANNLFQIAVANRLAEDLCWPVVFRQGWQGVFPHDARAVQCFPHGIGAHRRPPNDGNVTQFDSTWFEAMDIDRDTDHAWSSPEQFFREIPNADNYEIYDKWWRTSVKNGKSIMLGALHEYDYSSSTGWDNDLVANLRHPGNKSFITNYYEEPRLTRLFDTVRAVHLGAFFIDYRWMEPWMEEIRQWHAMDEAECCHHVPPDNAVVVHVRNFEDDDHAEVFHFSPNVYFEVLDRFYFGGDSPIRRELWIVCQPQDTQIELVKKLRVRYRGRVVTGDDPFDAFCTLTKAKNLFLSTASTFSQMAGLLAGPQATVHYMLTRLDKPLVTLVVPNWNYHLLTKNQSAIAVWNVNASDVIPLG